MARPQWQPRRLDLSDDGIDAMVEAVFADDSVDSHLRRNGFTIAYRPKRGSAIWRDARGNLYAESVALRRIQENET